MLVYMVYDKKTGKVVHSHRVVDLAGRSQSATDEEVLSLLPANIDAASVGIAPAELEQMPSSREASFSVDPKTRQFKQTRATASKAKKK